MTAKPLYPVPRRAATFGILLFLASLGMLFASSLIGYFVIRLFGPSSPSGRVLELPPILWLSTAAMLACSFTISRALRAVRAERQRQLKRYLLLTLALAITFVAIQAPALIELLRKHSAGAHLYGLLFFLVLLHALHVIGGLISLAVVIVGAFRGQYDHENHSGVRNMAFYWHFLDGVWLAMFLSLWIAG